MRINKKVITIIVSIAVTLFFILPGIGFSILNWGVLPPEKLTPLVIEQTNKFLDAHLDCKRIELTYFETYPHLGIKLINGHLISHAAEDSTAHTEELAIPSDSLLAFKQVVISFRPTDYLFGGKITVGEVNIEEPRFYGYVNKKGSANWDIYSSEPDSAATDKKPLPPIDLQKVRITNGRFTYDDRQGDLFAEINGFFLSLDGSLTTGGNKLDVETGCTSILFSSPTYTLANKLALKLKSQLLLSDNYNTVTLNNAELLVNNLPFTADGSVSSLPLLKQTRIDMEVGLKISDMNDLLHFIPDAYFQNRDKTVAKGSIIMEGNIHGFLGDSIVPSVNLCCKIENGSYHIKGVKQGIDTLQMDMDLHLNGIYPDSSFLSLEQLTLKGLTTSLDMQGKVTNLLTSPNVDTNIKGKIDFTRLAKEFINPDTLFLQGVMDADLSASFNVDDLLNSQYGKVHASGRLNIDTLKAYSLPLGMDVFIAKAHFSVDSTGLSSSYLDNKDLLSMSMSVDSLNVKYQDAISTNISKLAIQAKTSPVIDTTAVIPMTGQIRFDYLRTRLPDSVLLVAGKTVLKGGIKSSASDKRIPTLGATISVDTLRYFIIPMRTGMILSENTFNLEALPYRDAMRQRWLARTDTATRTNSARRLRRTRTTGSQVQIDSTDVTSQLLRQWEVRGSLSFKQMRGFSRMMPIPMKIDQTTLKFNTNDITLTDARLHLGKSDFMLNGEIKSIRQAMLRGGKLRGNFSLTSDYIDCNQLIKAINSGMQYAELQESTGHTGIDAESLATMDTHILQDSISVASLDTTDQVFVIPANLDMTLHTNAKKIDFKDAELSNVEGEIIIRDQSVNLSNLAMNSNIGRGNMTMFYTAKDSRGASAGFDLDMEDVMVEKLISLYPAIDTLVPMLRSFEGVVDCQITATCKMDSTMSLELPSLHSACYLHGENMVLLDGETFTEISKTLMFKNKKRNVIDSISVDLAIKDNKIEVFPFLVEMDRYKVAVGGTHNLDMTFNYHLSVLKSPVPFKLGIDITGNLDNFKYKIVKCRYKDLFKPAKEAELDSTRTNVRKEIRESIRKQIKETAPELVSSLSSNHSATSPDGETNVL
ncbi:AsmA-like C-terminal region-containing protein [uncultured Parabacteroides sp.]|uniref:AsmA-like C-terminal region-containing protein n=1 Tax=uncultured Parabacteroides sp. TaxID=512312 RepID=UPI002588DC28|nr:AsmA-like C-terminal region-containing protein [uncultured Parabacteroides sp.]